MEGTEVAIVARKLRFVPGPAYTKLNFRGMLERMNGVLGYGGEMGLSSDDLTMHSVNSVYVEEITQEHTD